MKRQKELFFCFDGWIGYQKRRERKVMRAGMFRWPRNYAVEAFISREGEEEEEEEINQNLGQLNNTQHKQKQSCPPDSFATPISHRHLPLIKESQLRMQLMNSQRVRGRRALPGLHQSPPSFTNHACSVFLAFSETAVFLNLAPFCNNPMCDQEYGQEDEEVGEKYQPVKITLKINLAKSH
uniref:Uncharacterized protein n=1 Tax=Salix viminalis TaxID=40686 RepID=A0A6N2N7B7_SALVM